MCYKCKCNTATNTKIIKIWVFRVDPIYLSCPANTIYDLPINLLYIYKRVPALVISLWIMPMKEKGNKIQKKSSNQKRWFLCKKYRSEGNISFVICSLFLAVPPDRHHFQQTMTHSLLASQVNLGDSENISPALLTKFSPKNSTTFFGDFVWRKHKVYSP